MISFNNRNIRFYSWLLKFTNFQSIKNKIFIGKKSAVSSITFINYGTRINGKIIIKGQGKCSIGKYCAIGDNVRIITTNHSVALMNLQYSLHHQLGLQNIIDDKRDVNIGNNVWVGDSVIILPGVSIGNGAVLGAGAIITKSVPPYAIVGGVPATIIKYRFDNAKIKKIENLKWWDWSFRQMKDNIKYFRDV